MELKKLGVQEKGAPNQDGAVWGKELFRLNHLGECVVRDMDTLQPKASFLLDKADINVVYLYAFMTRTEKHAYVVLRVEDNAAAEEVLTNAGFKMITEADVCKL